MLEGDSGTAGGRRGVPDNVKRAGLSRMKGDTDDDKDLDDKENELDNEGNEEVILGGEGESERDGASVSFEPSRFVCASASKC